MFLKSIPSCVVMDRLKQRFRALSCTQFPSTTKDTPDSHPLDSNSPRSIHVGILKALPRLNFCNENPNTNPHLHSSLYGHSTLISWEMPTPPKGSTLILNVPSPTSTPIAPLRLWAFDLQPVPHFDLHLAVPLQFVLAATLVAGAYPSNPCPFLAQIRTFSTE